MESHIQKEEETLHSVTSHIDLQNRSGWNEMPDDRKSVTLAITVH